MSRNMRAQNEHLAYGLLTADADPATYRELLSGGANRWQYPWQVLVASRNRDIAEDATDRALDPELRLTREHINANGNPFACGDSWHLSLVDMEHRVQHILNVTAFTHLADYVADVYLTTATALIGIQQGNPARMIRALITCPLIDADTLRAVPAWMTTDDPALQRALDRAIADREAHPPSDDTRDDPAWVVTALTAPTGALPLMLSMLAADRGAIAVYGLVAIDRRFPSNARRDALDVLIRHVNAHPSLLHRLPDTVVTALARVQNPTHMSERTAAALAATGDSTAAKAASRHLINSL